MIGSMMATSTTWPRPLASALRNAAVTAKLVARAAIPSASPNGGSVGGPVGLAGQGGEPAHRLGDRSEPRSLTRRDRTARRRSPWRSPVAGWRRAARRARVPSVPGCRGGSSRSARRCGRPGGAAAAAPSGRERLMVTVRLLRPSVFHHRPTPSRDGPWVRAASGPRRVLDLDDVGTEVAEEGRRQRSGEQRRGVDRRTHPVPDGPVGLPSCCSRRVLVVIEIPGEAEADRRRAVDAEPGEQQLGAELGWLRTAVEVPLRPVGHVRSIHP